MIIVTERKIKKLSEDVETLYEKLSDKTGKDAVLLSYFTGVVEGLSSARRGELDEEIVITDLTKIKSLQIIEKAAEATKKAHQSRKQEAPDD